MTPSSATASPASSHRMLHAVPLWAAENVLLGAMAKGHSRHELHARLGLTTRLAHDDCTLISMDRFALVLRQLSREMRDELVGLWHKPVPPGTFATVAQHMLQGETLGDCLRIGLRLYKLIAPGFPLHLQVDSGLCWIKCQDHRSTEVPAAAQLALHCAASYWVLSFARWLVERQIPVEQACMSSLRQDTRYQEPEPFFEVQARYAMPFTGFAFDARWLRRPVLREAESLRTFLRSAPVDLLRRHSIVPSVVEQVRAQLRIQPNQRLPTIEDVALTLGLSPRSLRRRLEMEGMAFQTLKDNVRRDVAMSWLSNTDLPVAEVGDRLGFSDPSAFHRSFKRWTGVSPGQYRRTASE